MLMRTLIVSLTVASFATTASATNPVVTLGGLTDFQAGFTDGPYQFGEPIAFRNDNELLVRVDGKTDAGLGYGAVIELEADLSPDIQNKGLNAARTFTYLEGGWGRVELGGNDSAAAVMRVDASTIAVATGGIAGDWADHTGFPIPGLGLGNAGLFITRPGLQMEHGDVLFMHDDFYGGASKITYYTPRFAGFQLGGSFTPQADANGQDVFRDGLEYTDVLDLGLSYHTRFYEETSLALALTYENSNTELIGGSSLEGWNVGGMLGHGSWQFAASYGAWVDGVPGLQVIPSVTGYYWTAGAATRQGALGLSASYMESVLDVFAENRFGNLVLSADYQLAPGLSPYVEAAFYRFEDNNFGSTDESGTTILVGTQIAF